jgi:hypothetical protein
MRFEKPVEIKDLLSRQGNRLPESELPKHLEPILRSDFSRLREKGRLQYGSDRLPQARNSLFDQKIKGRVADKERLSERETCLGDGRIEGP